MSSRAALRALVLTVLLAPCYCQNNCQYLFLEQPARTVGCNPWDYIRSQGDKLTLKCTVTGPWSTTDVPNVLWLKGDRAYLNNATQIYYDQKYSDLTSSEDLGTGLMRASFTLNVQRVDTLDIGCYWCQVQVHSSDCTSILFNSTVFCLGAEEAYSGRQSCTQIAPNMTQSCAGNFSCSSEVSSSPLPTSSTMPATSTDVISPPSTLTLSSVSSHTPASSFITTTTSFTPRPTSVVEHPSTLPSLITLDDRFQSSNIPTPPPPPPPPTLPPLPPTSPPPSPSPPLGQPTAPQPSAAVRVGLYVGVALCFVLLAVMTGLVAAIIVLLHKTPGTLPRSQQGSVNSRRELESSGSRSASLRSTLPLPLPLPLPTVTTPHGTAARPPVPPHQSDSYREARPLPLRGHYYHVLEGPLYEPTGDQRGPEGHRGHREANPVIVINDGNGGIITEGAAAASSGDGVYERVETVKGEDGREPHTKFTRNPR